MPKELIKPKQTRKRIPRTCAQCRKRKQKCDSLKPCAVCKLRGEADLCDYSGAQPTRVLDEEDEFINHISAEELKVLRQQVDDLEQAVTMVVNRPTTGPSPPSASQSSHRLSIDMDEFNLASILSTFLNSKKVTPEFGQELPIIQKVRRQCRLDQNSPVTPTNIYSTSGLSTYFNDQFNTSHFNELFNRLPTLEQSKALLQIYSKEFEWYHSCFNSLGYSAALENLYTSTSSSPNELDPDLLQCRFITMAICFAIARSAICRLPMQQAIDSQLPTEPSARFDQSKLWFDLSIACLKCAEFEVNPQLESVSCLIVLLEAAWFDVPVGGMEELSTLFDLKCKAMHLAFDLSLHRDPSHRDPSGTVHVNPVVARERRMIWWALLSIDGLYSGLNGRLSSIVGLEAVDVFLPALSTTAHPEEVHEGCEKGCTTSTPATGIKPRLLIGYVGHEISRLPLQRTPLPTINEIHQAHRDLVSLEVHLPDTYKLRTINNHFVDKSRLPQCSKARRDAFFFYLRYHYLFVKLHAPLQFVKKSEFEQTLGSETKHPYHRAAVVDHALLLLDLRNIGEFGPDYIYGNSMALEASFSLALDYLYEPKGEVSDLIKEELQNYCEFLKSSKIWFIKRGLSILECLMSTWGTPPPAGAMSWFSTNDESLSPCSWVQGPYHQPPESSFSSTEAETHLEKSSQPPKPEPPVYSCLRVFESSNVVDKPQALNQTTWAAPAPDPAISHYSRSQAELPDYKTSMAENRNDVCQFNPPVQFQGIFDRECIPTGHYAGPFNQFHPPKTGHEPHQHNYHQGSCGNGTCDHHEMASKTGGLNIEELFGSSGGGVMHVHHPNNPTARPVSNHHCSNTFGENPNHRYHTSAHHSDRSNGGCSVSPTIELGENGYLPTHPHPPQPYTPHHRSHAPQNHFAHSHHQSQTSQRPISHRSEW